MRRLGAGDRLHRGSRGDREDSGAPRPAGTVVSQPDSAAAGPEPAGCRGAEVGLPTRGIPEDQGLCTAYTRSPGDLRVQREGQEELYFYVTGGILVVQPMQVTVLADTVLRAEQTDESAADEASARYRAAQKLKGKRP